MDSVFPPAAVRRPDHHRRPPPPPPSDQGPSLVDTTPPRQPIIHCRRWTDTDPVPTRPCPAPPPPPLPVREPLQAAADRRPPPHHHGVVPAPTSTSVAPLRQTSPPAGVVSTALDSVVPLSHWPLRPFVPPVALQDKPLPHLDEPVRRGITRGLALPVNMLPVAPPVNHITQLPTAAPSCPNGRGNLYVDSPTVGRNGSVAPPQPERTGTATEGRSGLLHPPPSSAGHTAQSPPTVKFNPVVQTNGGGTGALTGSSEKSGVVVVGQPRRSGGGGCDSRGGVCRGGGIVCQRCGRCRCANCTAPRELPRRWIGDFECSVQRCVGVTSCLCCVEALFYHCLDGADADDGGTGGSADDPCACCERPRCCLRWSLMVGLAATVLPCLCCYCPLQCGADAVTACYNACASPRGCRCRYTAAQEASSGSSTRGLLAESESSST